METRGLLGGGPFDDRSPAVRIGVVAVIVAVAGLFAGAFLVDLGASTPEPAAYDDTVELGLTTDSDALQSSDARVPRAQVFYSGFHYVVGYHGIGPLLADLDDDRRDQQFGYPVVTYVETFDDADPGVTDGGLFTADDGAWSPATESWYVLDSEARTPVGTATVPFASRPAAATFADAFGGSVVDWPTLRERGAGDDVDTAEGVRATATERWERADDAVEHATELRDRPRSVTVGDDEPTIQAAVDAAPPNTTVVVPPGTYEETVTVNRSVTIAGEGATVDGGGNGSVITVRAAGVAVTGLHVTGTGNETRDEDAVSDRPDDDEEWDRNVQLGYGHGDAGIRAIDAPGLFVENVTVETDASGLLLREGSDATIRETHVDGAETWQDGFMGIVAMQSHVIVEEATFAGGRDGIYLHRADDSVIRRSTFEDNRYGVHLMYSNDALIADNVVRNATFGGITVMTRPSGNAIVGNDVRDSPAGIQASGLRTYVAYNTLANNDLGFSTSARNSLYEHNVLVDNEVGVRATTVVPASRVVRNDFVGNEHHAGAGAGPLRVWSDDGVGNYWEGAYGEPVGDVYDRPYSPTSPVDSSLHREPAATPLAEGPATRAVTGLFGTAPGMRTGSIVDDAPAREPIDPDRVRAVRDDPTGAAIPDWRNDAGTDRGEEHE